RLAVDRDGTWQRRALEVRVELAGAVARRGVPLPDVAALDQLVTRCRFQGVIGAVLDEALTVEEAADRLAGRAAGLADDGRWPGEAAPPSGLKPKERKTFRKR